MRMKLPEEFIGYEDATIRTLDDFKHWARYYGLKKEGFNV
jgi:hypothetical protein